MSNAPIAFFAYKRPWHTAQALESLSRCNGAAESELYIFCDGPRSPADEDAVAEVRRLVKSRPWCGTIHVVERDENLGLATSIILGVTEVVNRHGRSIVLEDDLVVSPFFIGYMRDALEHYEQDKHVFSITGFTYSPDMLPLPAEYPYTTYFGYRCNSWSWATWSDRWGKVDFDVKDYDSFMRDHTSQELFRRGGDDLVDMLRLQQEGRIDSWAIRFCYAHFKNNAYCLYPVHPLVRNIGVDGSGTHCRSSSRFDVKLWSGEFDIRYPGHVEPDPIIAQRFRRIFSPHLSEKLRDVVRSFLGRCRK